MVKRICHSVVLAMCAILLPGTSWGQPATEPSANDSAAPPAVESQAPVAVPSLPGSSAYTLVAPDNFLSPFASVFTPAGAPSTTPELQSYYSSGSRSRLRAVPEMFGDYRRATPTLVITPATGALPGLTTEVPVAAAISGLRAAENNHALPGNREWVAYNYFAQAFDTSTAAAAGLPPTTGSESLHRTVVAIERVIDAGQTSIEVRMPFGSAFGARGVAGAGGGATAFAVEGHSIGNLNLLLKRLIYARPDSAFSAGIGLELPTGSRGDIAFGALSATLDSRAAHLVPYLAYTQKYNRWFGHLFTQLDIATGGDPLRASLDMATPVAAGSVDQPVLLGIDAGVGYWLLQPAGDQGSGLALVSELHSTTGLSGADSFTAVGALGTFAINTPDPAYDLLNLTSGVHAELGGGWSLRTAGVFPLRRERVFDAEFVLQINHSH